MKYTGQEDAFIGRRPEAPLQTPCTTARTPLATRANHCRCAAAGQRDTRAAGAGAAAIATITTGVVGRAAVAAGGAISPPPSHCGLAVPPAERHARAAYSAITAGRHCRRCWWSRHFPRHRRQRRLSPVIVKVPPAVNATPVPPNTAIAAIAAITAVVGRAPLPARTTRYQHQWVPLVIRKGSAAGQSRAGAARARAAAVAAVTVIALLPPPPPPHRPRRRVVVPVALVLLPRPEVSKP